MKIRRKGDRLELISRKGLGEIMLGCLLLIAGLACLYGALVAYSQEWSHQFGDIFEELGLFAAILGGVLGVGLVGGGGLLIFSRSNRHVFEKRRGSLVSSGHLSSSLTGVTFEIDEIAQVLVNTGKDGSAEWYWVGLILANQDIIFLPERFLSLQEAEQVARSISEFCQIPVRTGNSENKIPGS